MIFLLLAPSFLALASPSPAQPLASTDVAGHAIPSQKHLIESSEALEAASEGILAFVRQNHLSDADPFFLRQQLANPSALIPEGLEPLTPLEGQQEPPLGQRGHSSEYIWLRPAASLLAKIPHSAEGLFVVRRVDLDLRVRTGHAIPFFFVPLLTHLWDQAIEAPATDSVLLRSHPESPETRPLWSSFSLHDLRRLLDFQSRNLQLAKLMEAEPFMAKALHDHPEFQAQSSTLQHKLLTRGHSDIRRSDEASDLASLRKTAFSVSRQILNKTLPAPHSTAYFGMVLNRLPVHQSWYRTTSSLAAPIDLYHHLLPRAWGHDDASHPSLGKTAVRFAIVAGGALAFSVALRFSKFREFFRQKEEKARACEANLEIGSARRLWNQVARQGEYLLDIYAQTLTVFRQFSRLWFGNAVEYLGDRFATRLLAAASAPLRRYFLEPTILFSRDTQRNLGSNAKTFLLGGALGMLEDTSQFYVQLYYVTPAVQSLIGSYVPALHDRIEHVQQDPAGSIDRINRYEVARLGISYWVSGASSLSQNLRAQNLSHVTTQVEDELKREGLDPLAVENQPELQRRIDEKLDAILTRYGLPHPKNTLFDGQTLWNRLMGLGGLSLPQTPLNGTNPEEDVYEYMAVDRPGLVIPALQRVVKFTRQQDQFYQQAAPWQDLKRIFEFLEVRGSPLSAFLTRSSLANTSGLTAMRALRQTLVSFTISQTHDLQLSQIPDQWIQWIAEALDLDSKGSVQVQAHVKAIAILAANLYRLSFQSLLSGHDIDLGVTPSLRHCHGQAAWKECHHEHVSPDDSISSQSRRELMEEVSRQPVEFKARFDRAVEDLERQRLQLLRSDRDQLSLPGKEGWQGWFVRLQLRRAHDLAMERYSRSEGLSLDDAMDKAWDAFPAENNTGAPATSTTDAYRQWRDVFSHSLLEVLGTRYHAGDLGDLGTSIAQQSQQQLTNQKESSKELADYLSELDPRERARTEGELFAVNFVTNYVKSLQSRSITMPLSPAQPGRFQSWRQSSWARDSKALTRALRTFEIFFHDQETQLGLGAWMNRNIPLWYLFINSHERVLRDLPTAWFATNTFNDLVWGIRLPPAERFYSILTYGMFFMPEQALNNLFRLQGIQPMKNFKTYFYFALLYSWMTFWGAIPEQLFLRDFVQLWNTIGRWLN